MTRAEIVATISSILSDLLDQEGLQISEATIADDVEGWDSINHVRLILGLESELHIAFDTAEVEGAGNVGQLIDVIERKLA